MKQFCSFLLQEDKEAFLTLQDKKGLKKGRLEILWRNPITVHFFHVLLMYVPCQKSYFLDFFESQFETFFAGEIQPELVAAEVVQISNGFFCIIFSCGTGIR